VEQNDHDISVQKDSGHGMFEVIKICC